MGGTKNPDRPLLDLDLGFSGIRFLQRQYQRRRRILVGDVMRVSAALVHDARGFASHLLAVGFFRPHRPAALPHFLAVEFERLVDRLARNEAQHRLVRRIFDVARILRKRKIRLQRQHRVLHAGRVVLRGRDHHGNV